MRSVVLSTTEAAYVAISEVVKEIKFVYQLFGVNGCEIAITHQSEG